MLSFPRKRESGSYGAYLNARVHGHDKGRRWPIAYPSDRRRALRVRRDRVTLQSLRLVDELPQRAEWCVSSYACKDGCAALRLEKTDPSRKMWLVVRLAILLALPATNASAEDGRPVTAKDLSGKTYCWDNGHKGTYGGNGNYSNVAGYRGTWSVPEPGVVHVGTSQSQIEVLSDGRLRIHVFHGGSDRPDRGDVNHWATPCN